MGSLTPALSYSSINKPQFDIGRDFVRLLNIKKGDKVLDMGCGTGELTRFIAELVGESGEVVGVDPDEQRVKVAREKLSDLPNVKIAVGNSATWFPHHNEEYYDTHFSNMVFHWLKTKEKRGYSKQAFRCLKPGGQIAIQTSSPSEYLANRMLDNLKKNPVITLIGEEEVHQLLCDSGFQESKATPVRYKVNHASYDSLSAWWKASCYCDLTDLDDKLLKELRNEMTEPDQPVRFDFIGLQITGSKLSSDAEME